MVNDGPSEDQLTHLLLLWNFYMLLTPLYQPVNQKGNLRWEYILHVLIHLGHPSHPVHQESAQGILLLLSLAHQLLCPSCSLCHKNIICPTSPHLFNLQWQTLKMKALYWTICLLYPSRLVSPLDSKNTTISISMWIL
jgi:hypothetical protein